MFNFVTKNVLLLGDGGGKVPGHSSLQGDLSTTTKILSDLNEILKGGRVCKKIWGACHC